VKTPPYRTEVTFEAMSEGMSEAMRRFRALCVAPLALAVALLAVTGCHKKAAPPPPPPPPAATGTAPTATLTANPAAINPGENSTLTWRTTDATDVSIDGIGPVPSSGTKNVSPKQSTDYHLVARGLGGSTDATARVTVNAASSTADTGTEQLDDATFHANVQDIFFDYDSYDINTPSQGIVSKDAGFLAAHPKLKIVIGGYCDERGSTEYNLALGENRANAAKQALVTAGVNPDRIRTVSYGKEKQFCTEHDESCYQQNRRAGFSVDR
jgi:peptidoglycan-associated lipoprotein